MSTFRRTEHLLLMIGVLSICSCASPIDHAAVYPPEIWTTSLSHDFTTADTQIYQIDSSSWVALVTNHKYREQYTIELKIQDSTVKKIIKYKINEYKNGVLDLAAAVSEGVKLVNSGTITKKDQQYFVLYDQGLVSGELVLLSPKKQETYTLSSGNDSLILGLTGDVYVKSEDIAPNI